ncbi:MAG: SDR family oxidoreductase [Kiritimatiellae bacterium]|nr:SDR family oxidoreductase [Kiritimatiellia bacterium]
MPQHPDNLFDLSGRNALVTGAGSGLGRGIAEGYARYGAKVAVVDIDEEAARAIARGISDAGGHAVAIACDVADSSSVTAAVNEAASQLGDIDILLNNAGIGKRSKAEEMSDEYWDLVLDINLKGAFRFCREVGVRMIERGRGGRIINMASVTALVGIDTGNANYAASKGGLVAMTRCLAVEWAPHNILVNAIAPSHTRTPLIEKLMAEKPETRTYFLNNIPLGRLGTVGDIVGPAVFLASDAASFITGHTLLVDGGHTAK